MSQPRNVPPARIPVLTEVLTDALDAGPDDEEPTRPMLDAALAPPVEAPPRADDHPPARPTSDDEAIAMRVLEALHRQIDAIVDRRVQAALEPIWRRLTEDLADEARMALALALKETLREAVREEIRRPASASPASGGD
jgi:hypothetical protein